MPKITPALPHAHPTHADPDSEFGNGWCLPCYEAGSFTLAIGSADRTCLLHGAVSAPPSTGDDRATHTPPSASTAQRRAPRPRGVAGHRPAPPSRPRQRARTVRRTADRQQARARAYGRRRAAVRLTAGGYAPHPGWRHFIAPGWRVLVDQTEALAVIETLIDGQDWRADKRAAWTAILRQLVCAMDWNTGLVCALTAQRLADAGARAPRTVSRVIAWARDIGLVVVVEHAASAEFLTTDHGRTPTYALVTNTPLPQPAMITAAEAGHTDAAQRTLPVDESGDLPASSVEIKPLNGKRLKPTTPAEPAWPLYRVPESAPERTAAAHRFLERLGLNRGGIPAVPLWRTRALLRPWWDAGACPAALLWAINHHPDNPTHHRGDALRGTRDPLRVLGHRLQPWRGRLGQLPPQVVGTRGDYVTAQQTRRSAPSTATPQHGRRPTTAAQRSAQAALRNHLAQLRRRRRTEQ